MRRTSWMLGAFAAVMLGACGGRADDQTTGGAETGAGTGTMTDTTTMAPGAATTDTALGGGTGATPADTAAADTATTR